jgi:hypothetical protein
MSHRTAAWLAWSLWTGCVALLGLALFLDFLTDEVLPPGPPGERPGPALAVLTGVLSLAFPTVGALIAARLPTNPIGCSTLRSASAQRTPTTRCSRTSRFLVGSTWPGSQG